MNTPWSGDRVFPLSENREQDEARAARMRQTDERLARDVCPNDETPLVEASPHERECPRCGFHWSHG